MPDDAILEAARNIVAGAAKVEDARSSDVEISADGQSSNPTLDKQIDSALEKMNGDPAAASTLFLRWAEGDSEIRDLIPPILEDYIRQRVAARAQTIPNSQE